MRSSHAWRATLLATWSVAVLAVARLASRSPLGADDVIAPPFITGSDVAPIRPTLGPRTASLVDSIVAHDPFGLFMESADASPATTTPMPFSRPPMPSATPRVQAVVGPPWRALLSAPGVGTAREVATGDSAFGYVVTRISATAVRLRGRDTLITLTPGGPE
jgi:hypothetical protein